MTLKLRRGLEADRAAITPAEGELIYTTDEKKVFVGDGTTVGGNPLDTIGSSFSGSYNDLTDKPTIPADISDLTDTQSLLGGTLTTAQANASVAGPVTSLSTSATPNENWVSTTGVAVSDLILDIAFVANLPVVTIVNGGAAEHTVGEQIVVPGTAVGATSPADDITFIVDSVTLTPLAIDLTKQVAKLKDGRYTVADGVEGQEIKFVLQDNTSNRQEIRVTFANARVNGSKYQNIFMLPFADGEPGVLSAVFTDGAWQSTSGQWD